MITVRRRGRHLSGAGSPAYRTAYPRLRAEEIRQGLQLRERMAQDRVVQIINFEAGSWEIAPDQYPKLERLARAINRILQDRPDEVFFIEGHADVLDSDVDNLTLSDRRAEAVAFILSQMFAVPAENLVTQGYGDQYLKADGGKINRRVSVRRITPLLRSAIPRRGALPARYAFAAINST